MAKITINFVDNSSETENMSDSEAKEMEAPYKIVVGAIAEDKGKFVKSVVYYMENYKMTLEKIK